MTAVLKNLREVCTLVLINVSHLIFLKNPQPCQMQIMWTANRTFNDLQEDRVGALVRSAPERAQPHYGEVDYEF